VQGVFDGFHRRSKFGWNRRGSFDSMQVLIFSKFGLKVSIHTAFVFLEICCPELGAVLVTYQK